MSADQPHFVTVRTDSGALWECDPSTAEALELTPLTADELAAEAYRVLTGGPEWVGEHGPEVVDLPEGTHISPDDPSEEDHTDSAAPQPDSAVDGLSAESPEEE
jgi:hypothetical protein